MQINYDELLRPYYGLFSGSNNPVAYFDDRFICIRETGGVVSVGESLMSYLRDPLIYPVNNLTEVTFYKDEKFYCCRIMPVKNGSGEAAAYICELIGKESARIIAERADSASDILPIYNSVEYYSAIIWKTTKKLHNEFQKSKDYSRLAEVLEIELAMSNISSVCSNAFEYMNMLYSSQNKVVIDAGSLCRSLAERCNAALAKCGRRIEALIEPSCLTIYADSRRAAAALVNAVQNALLYSPRDSEPILTVYRAERDGRAYVEIRLTNENIMFTSKDFKQKMDINFCYQRLGYGIPIIKRFARVCGGSFTMNDEGGKVIVTLSLPAADVIANGRVLKSPDFSDYCTDIPDFTEIMLREVVQFFGEKEEIHS